MNYNSFMSQIKVLSEAFSKTGDEIAIYATDIRKGQAGNVMSWRLKLMSIDDSMKETPIKVSSSALRSIENSIGTSEIIKGIELVNDKKVVITYTEALKDSKGNLAINVGNKNITL